MYYNYNYCMLKIFNIYFEVIDFIQSIVNSFLHTKSDIFLSYLNWYK